MIFQPPSFSRNPHLHPLADYGYGTNINYEEIKQAYAIYTACNIPASWAQLLFKKPLSAFESKDWSIYCGLAYWITRGRVQPTDYRKYVVDMLEWAQMRNEIHEYMFELEEWPMDPSAFLDLPDVRDFRPASVN